VANGGTGLASGTSGNVLYFSGSTTISNAAIKSEYVWTVPSNITVANGTTTIEPNFPWAAGTITSVDYGTNGSSPSFVASVNIGGVAVVSCSSITVSSSTNTNVACTGSNTLSPGSIITVEISGVSGTPNQAWFKVNLTHSVN